MEHRLKTWPVFFADTEVGAKRFEIRKNDRDFHVGDFLRLEEYDPQKGYTDDFVLAEIDYIVSLDGIPDMPDGFVGMSISLI